MKLLDVLRPICLSVLVCGTAVACGAEEDPAVSAAPVAAADSSAGPDSTFASEPDRVLLPADRIYYTLTAHEWYARGEPLVHEGRSFNPAGMPVAASLSEMERVGEYQGVEYYRRTGDDTTLFVPVYRGYWQVFRSATAAR